MRIMIPVTCHFVVRFGSNLGNQCTDTESKPHLGNQSVLSQNGVAIRLPDERWAHIVDEHGELTGYRSLILRTIAEPERILAGVRGELLAIREAEPQKWLVVVYRELDHDGFIITAFLTRRIRSLDKRAQLWP
jgi:hypothetical protein